MIDFLRMLLGEVVSVSVVAPDTAFAAGPIAGDVNVTCTLQLENGVVAILNPLRFRHYRENGIEVWGEGGRLAIYNEGLTIAHYARADNRAMTGEREVAADAPRYVESTVGSALYNMFTNLADALDAGATLWSPGGSALRTAAVVAAIRRSADEERVVRVDEVAATPVSAFTA
jgi:predicted dehydrogenase